MVKTKFNKTFFCTELPIIQALMAGVQESTFTLRLCGPDRHSISALYWNKNQSNLTGIYKKQKKQQDCHHKLFLVPDPGPWNWKQKHLINWSNQCRYTRISACCSRNLCFTYKSWRSYNWRFYTTLVWGKYQRLQWNSFCRINTVAANWTLKYL